MKNRLLLALALLFTMQSSSAPLYVKSIEINPSSCGALGQPYGFSMSAGGGNGGPYSYVISNIPQGGTFSASIPSAQFPTFPITIPNGLEEPSTYTYTITDGSSAPVSLSFMLSAVGDNVTSFKALFTPACAGAQASIFVECQGTPSIGETSLILGTSLGLLFFQKYPGTTFTQTINIAPPFVTYLLQFQENVCGSSRTNFSFVLPTLDALLIDSMSTTAPSCSNSSDGSIHFSVTGGTGTYASACATSVATGTSTCITNFSSGMQTISGLTAGAYTLAVTDSNGCTATSTPGGLNVPEAGQIVVNYTVTSPTCAGGTNGFIAFNVQNGAAPYSAQLKTGAQVLQSISAIGEGVQKLFTNLSAGIPYTIEVTDARGCLETTQPITLPQPNPLTIQNLQSQPAACNGGKGSVSFAVSGGLAPYTACLRNGSFQQCITNIAAGVTKTITNVPVGSFNLTINDSNSPSCSTMGAVTVSQPAPLSLQVGVVRESSCTGNAGKNLITANASGGTAPYTYSIGGAFQSSNLFHCVRKGKYTVSVKDSKGCTAQRQINATH